MNKFAVINKFSFVSKYLFATVMVVFGIQHFIYADFVATLVPGWLPFHLFWVYFTGIALIAGAVSIYFNRNAKLACFLLGTMIWIFILTVHIPILINSHFSAGMITNACKDIGLASCAFMLSATLKD
jgi:putative oxidoreductase